LPAACLDSRIRDFCGLQENDWAFNDVSGVLGFGSLERSGNAKLFAAQVFSKPDGEIVSSLSRSPSLSFLYFGAFFPSDRPKAG
jgi:hypothetical protein